MVWALFAFFKNKAENRKSGQLILLNLVLHSKQRLLRSNVDRSTEKMTDYCDPVVHAH